MNTALILQIITVVGALLKAGVEDGPIILKTVQDAQIFVNQLFAKLMGRDPTADEEAQVWAAIQTLSAQLQTPLPPADDQDT